MVLKQGTDGSLWYKVLEKQEAVKFKDLGPEQMMVYQVSYYLLMSFISLSKLALYFSNRCVPYCTSSRHVYLYMSYMLCFSLSSFLSLKHPYIRLCNLSGY